MIEDLKKRLILKYDTLISELEEIDKENKAFVKTANMTPEDPIIVEWSRFASDNKRRLEMAKAEKKQLEEIHLKRV